MESEIHTLELWNVAKYEWHPIEDYEIDPDRLAKAELRQLSEIWEEQRHELEQAEELKTFNERLRREWAIETGLLERIYTLDRGVTQMMIERGIDASLIPHGNGGSSPERTVAIIRDHQDAIDGLFSFVRGERPLSTSYIKELHAQLTRNQPTSEAIDSQGNLVEVALTRGDYKRQPNNPTQSDGSLHEYCPPEQVSVQMEELIRLYDVHSSVAPEVESAWLHHRFTQIHPFQDENGRVARCLATIEFLKTGWFPLVVRDINEERGRYLDALAAADHQDLQPLVNIFAAAQRKAFVQALGTSSQAGRSGRVVR